MNLEDALPRGVELADDVSPADWVLEGLRPWGREGVPVTSLVPKRFESYARIQHVEDAEGSLPEVQMRALTEVLGEFTTAARRCWFCIWDGWGFWFTGSHGMLMSPYNAERAGEYERVSEERDRIMRQAPLVKAQARDYFLFSGPLPAAESLVEWEGPQIWWPDDRAWCVGTDIDLRDTYVAGSAECIERLVETAGLDATEVAPEDDVNELHKW